MKYFRRTSGLYAPPHAFMRRDTSACCWLTGTGCMSAIIPYTSDLFESRLYCRIEGLIYPVPLGINRDVVSARGDALRLADCHAADLLDRLILARTGQR